MPKYVRGSFSEAFSSGLVVDQARKTGFTIRNRDELSERQAALGKDGLATADIATPSTPKEKQVSGEFLVNA